MKTLTLPRRIFIFAMMSLLTLPLFAQRVNTLRPGWYTLGINAGLSYQQSDVAAQIRGGGLGITLAKNLNSRHGQLLEVDLRGRLMYSTSYGLDADRNYLIEENTAVNGSGLWDYREFPSELEELDGFIFNNHRTQMGELGLEAVFTLGRLRQRTGINLSVFGGIGVDWYRVKTDQGNESSNTDYTADYAALDTSATFAQRRSLLRNDILNGTYESLGDGFEDDSNGKATLMPNWGVELGYDITPRWGIGLGHKVTYTGVDIFDGVKMPSTKNDIHHYTYLQLYYRFNVDEKEELPPTVRFTDPEYSPYMTKEPYKVVEAEITNVKDQGQINLTNNGRPLSFTYRKGTLKATIILDEGTNVVKAVATNGGGTGEDEVQIIVEEPETENPPVIRFIRPEVSGQVVSNAKYDVLAEILYMETDKNIVYTLNGRENKSWKFDTRTGMFNSSITLIEGENILMLDARNRRGSDRQTIRIIYEAPVYPPSIQFITPSVTPFRTTVPGQALELGLKEIKRTDNIQLTYNGYAFTRYDYNENTGRLSSQLALQKGQNFLTIIVSNKAGQAREDMVIILDDVPPPPVFPPRVTIQSVSNPTYNNSSKNCVVNVTARVEYVKLASDLDIRIGGSRISNFDFNPNTGNLNFQANIKEGSSNLIITGRNASGESRDERLLTCNAPVLPQPAVSIQNPANQSVSTVANVTLRANAKNVSQKSEITLTLNGRSTTAFTFNAANGAIEGNLILGAGKNTIAIRVSNAGGTANASVEVEYKAPALPLLTITSPSNGAVLNDPAIKLTGSVTNITAGNQIKIYLNNQLIGNPILRAGQYSLDLTLKSGENTLRAVADNGNGTSEQTVKVKYEIRYEKPVISFVNPAQNTTVEVSRLDLQARVTNIDRAEQIKLILNGRNQSALTFDKESGMLSKALTLRIGKNTIEIEAINPGGSAKEKIEVNYDPTISALPPPEVKIESASRPVSDPFNPNAAPTSTVLATLKGISNASQITFAVNGVPERGFSFDASTGKLQHVIGLNKGDNVIVLTVTNAKGTATDTTNVKL
jgi:hypothetical protein